MFWDNFYNLCLKNDTKPNPVAKELGISSATVTKWKKGSVPNGNTLQKISDYFGVSIDCLVSGENPKPSSANTELTDYLDELKSRPEMRMLFSLAKGATKEDVERAVTIIESLKKNEQ